MKKIQKEPHSENLKDQQQKLISLFKDSHAKKENQDLERFSPTKPKSKDIISSTESKGFEKEIISSGQLSDSKKFKNSELDDYYQQEKGNTNKIKFLDVYPMNRSRSSHMEQQQYKNKIKITEVPMNNYYKGGAQIIQQYVKQETQVIKAPQKCLWTNKQRLKVSACGFSIQSNDFEKYIQSQLEENQKFMCKCKRLASLKYLTLDHNTVFKMLKSQFKFTWDCPRQCGYFCILDVKRSANNIICPVCLV